LLAIFAKRQDARAYAAMAALAYPLLQTNAPQWAEVCASGLALDPANAMYLAGGQPAIAVTSAPVLSSPSQSEQPPWAVTQVALPVPELPAEDPQDSALDLDLDLDFSLDSPELAKVAEAATPVLPLVADSFMPELETAVSKPAPAPVVVAPAAASAPMDMLAFDFGGLSLDLDDSDGVPTKQPPLTNVDALESKLALAQEFKAKGEDELARDLIEQVIKESDGPLQARAQQALSQF
jgi:pilus assembly protein FimV